MPFFPEHHDSSGSDGFGLGGDPKDAVALHRNSGLWVCRTVCLMKNNLTSSCDKGHSSRYLIGLNGIIKHLIDARETFLGHSGPHGRRGAQNGGSLQACREMKNHPDQGPKAETLQYGSVVHAKS